MATDEQRALWSAILTNPLDDAPRLVYADWLQEGGVERRGATPNRRRDGRERRRDRRSRALPVAVAPRTDLRVDHGGRRAGTRTPAARPRTVRARPARQPAHGRRGVRAGRVAVPR